MGNPVLAPGFSLDYTLDHWSNQESEIPRPRWERLDEARKGRILTAATQEFAENGFEGASYNGIIEAAGISKGAMYYYFDDKMDLFVTTVRAALEPSMGGMEQLRQASAEDFWDTVEAWTLGSIVFTQRHPEQLTLYRELRSLHHSHHQHPLVAALFSEFESLTQVILEMGRGHGVVRTDLPHGMLEAAVAGLCEGLDAWYLHHLDPDEDPEPVAHNTTDMIRRLCAPKENPC